MTRDPPGDGPSATGGHEVYSARTTSPLSRFAKAAVALEVFLSVGALGGGGALMLGSRGEIIPLPLSALSGSPFDTYFVPGLFLFGVLGLGPLVAALLAVRRHPMAPLAAVAVGVALFIWLAVEIAIVGFTNDPPLQAFYLLLGSAITVVGLGWIAEVRAVGATPRGNAQAGPTRADTGAAPPDGISPIAVHRFTQFGDSHDSRC